MTMDRKTHRLVSEILTVLERNGHHRHGGQHTDQAVALIIDLARIYDGSIDVPVSTGRHAASTPNPETELPDRPPVPDSFILAGAEISTTFAALDLAAEYKRD